MKILILSMILSTLTLLGEVDCEKKEVKDKGCKVQVSEELIECLIEAKNDEEVLKCHSIAKEKKCKHLKDKFQQKDDFLNQCINRFEDERIECLLDAESLDKCPVKK
ncbi:hypothetical protein JXR93_05635 [bacterium]|nr:hypothetical protein [bacterium]